MNERFKDMLQVSRVYKKGERVFFDTCTNSVGNIICCAKCPNNWCNLHGKKEGTYGTIRSISTDGNDIYQIEVVSKHAFQDIKKRKKTEIVGDLYTVPREWVNRSLYRTQEENKLIDRFIW